MTLAELNELPEAEVRRVLLECCGSTRWADQMAAARPFGSLEQVLLAADAAADELTDQDWLEAFAAHPRIGERSSSHWSQREQAGTLSADAQLLQGLAQANESYYTRHGFIFIVFATGKTPQEMLALLRERLPNDTATEIRNAAAEQRKITRLRLERLLES